MKHTIIILLLCFFSQSALTQNYYVAVIKGTVYYQNKQLQKRHKIKIGGQLKFSSIDDYIKVSGPGGLYTIRPKADNKVSGNEFLIAVSKDLFPSIRYRATSANNISVTNNHYYDFQGNHYSFFNKTALAIEQEWIENNNQLVWLHQTTEGLVSQTATIKKGTLLIKKSDFTLSSANKTPLGIDSTAIVCVKDMEEWLELIEGKQRIADILPDVEIYRHSYSSSQDSVPANKPANETTARQIASKPAVILDYLDVVNFVSERKFTKDMRFFIRSCEPESEDEFLNDFEFKNYIWNNYGNLYWRCLSKTLNETIAYW